MLQDESIFSLVQALEIEESCVSLYLTADKPEEQLLQCRELF
jgi:hypothetical protein